MRQHQQAVCGNTRLQAIPIGACGSISRPYAEKPGCRLFPSAHAAASAGRMRIRIPAVSAESLTRAPDGWFPVACGSGPSGALLLSSSLLNGILHMHTGLLMLPQCCAWTAVQLVFGSAHEAKARKGREGMQKMSAVGFRRCA